MVIITHAGVVILVDMDGPKSITNDAENVVNELKSYGVDVDMCRIFYQDTERRWGELGVARGQFSGLVDLSEAEVAYAARLLASPAEHAPE
jgi:hypothetical protein